jgi:Cyclin, N-terminal domain
VANVGGRNVANGGKVSAPAAEKPSTSRRGSGVTTRSMSHGSTVPEEVFRQHAETLNNPPVQPPDVFHRGGRLLADPTSYQVTGNVDDIDERDRDDPLCATSYVADMYDHFRGKELTTSVRPGFMNNQTHINERMRAILVDWLVEVHLKFKLVPETLYLTINLIDRYLVRKEVSRPKLQLVGVTCLLIASKYEEIYPPELRDLVYICDRAYAKTDVSSALPC